MLKNKTAEIAHKKKVKALEKEYKKAVKRHKKLQSGKVNRRAKKSARTGNRLRDNRKQLLGSHSRGGSFRKNLRRSKNRARYRRAKTGVGSFISNVGSGIGKGLATVGKGFGKVGRGLSKIKLPKIKWPRLFKR